MGPISIATWNVHGCVGTDGRRDRARIERVIGEISPDVIALQEFDFPSGVPLDVHEPAFLESCAGYACVRGPTMLRRGDHFGNVLLSRLPIRDVDRLDLSVDRREPRGALDVWLDAGGVELRVVSTHFGLALHERRRQVERLIGRLAAAEAQLLVVAGDFNDWLPGRTAAAALDRLLGRCAAPRSFPSRLPILSLDRIWVRPCDAVGDVRVHASPLARAASDHLPVVASVDPGRVTTSASTR